MDLDVYRNALRDEWKRGGRDGSMESERTMEEGKSLCRRTTGTALSGPD